MSPNTFSPPHLKKKTDHKKQKESKHKPKTKSVFKQFKYFAHSLREKMKTIKKKQEVKLETPSE